ncbi:MAG: SUF system NifU family Fe-S cluster assembly protein [Vampirovibrionales bacterium]|nr:SUF system NifU family Fe-S cluster assembly protein [Vampirovibrionales bacterium]
MSDYNELYQQVILEHNKKPRNFKLLDDPEAKKAVGKNPLCGDHYYVSVALDEAGNVEDVGFQGDGCAISKASASMMTQAVKGKPKEDVLKMRDEFHQMLTQALPEGHHLGRLTILQGVKEFPVRVKCATLAWHTLAAAIEGEAEVSTE